jgi:hypothetical protein
VQNTESDEDGKEFSDFSRKFTETNRIENYEIYKHYDNIIGDIDIRAESLIQFVNQSRDDLQQKVKALRQEELSIFNDSESQNQEIQAIKTIKAKLQNLSDSSLKPQDQDLKTLLNESNQFQHFIFELKRNLWYFCENSSKMDNSLLGRMLNGKFDTTFNKLKRLSSLLAEDGDKTMSTNKVCLASDFAQSILRQEVLTLDRIVKIYFTTYRTLHFEMFDLHGKLAKSLNVHEGLSSFPISAGFGQYFVVCFTHEGNHIIHLYDTVGLNLIKSLKKSTSVESVFMNDKFVILIYAHKINACCQVYDHRMNEVFSFGQQNDKNKPFFMEKSELSWQEEKKMSFKLNPRIFGFTEKYIYLCNFNKMSIMSRQTGNIVRSLNLIGNRPFFLLDVQDNIIQVNPLGKKLTLYNSDLELLNESMYTDSLDTCHVTKENKLAFVDVEKKYIIYV